MRNKLFFYLGFFTCLSSNCFSLDEGTSATSTYHSTRLNGSVESVFKRYTKNEFKTGKPIYTWEASGWKGERVSTQLVLWSTTSLTNLRYNIEPFSSKKNTLPSSATQLRFVKYVKGDLDAKDCGKI